MQTTAQELGKKAFEAGKPCVPALDKEFGEYIKGGGHVKIMDALNDWHRGWAVANCAAPVTGE